MKEPPRAAQLPGKDKITVPVAKPPTLEAPKITKNEPTPVETLNIPAKELAASQDSLPGAIAAPSAPSLSQGSGSGGGAGTGTGSGIGPGTGSGLGPGSGGGTGGGTYRLGSGVTTPQLVREVKPQYTSDAMRAKIQGEVLVECVIKADGTVGDVQVIRSLDSTFGLDQEAIKAVRQWRFRPGTAEGRAGPGHGPGRRQFHPALTSFAATLSRGNYFPAEFPAHKKAWQELLPARLFQRSAYL